MRIELRLIVIVWNYIICSNRWHLGCKTVGFFLKISKEIGKAWRKSLVRAKRASLTGWVKREKKNVFLASLPNLALCFQPCPDLLFDCSRVLEYAKIRTVLQSRWHLKGLRIPHSRFLKFYKPSKNMADSIYSSRSTVFYPFLVVLKL